MNQLADEVQNKRLNYDLNPIKTYMGVNMFNEMKETIKEKKLEQAINEAAMELLDVTEAEDEMFDLGIAHERGKLDGIEFACLFLNEEAGSEAEDMEDELADAEDCDDDLLSNMDVSEDDMDVEGECDDDIKGTAADDAELTGDELFDVADEISGDDAGSDLDDDVDISGLDDLDSEFE
jgi:hypothetical protein